VSPEHRISGSIQVLMSDFRSLDRILNPRSVAIAGVAPAEAGEFNTGLLFLETILEYGFKGNLYPLNPRGGESLGLKVYANIKDVPETVDYVISCIPARHVLQLVRDCAEAAVRAICLFTAGFSETGRQEAEALERDVARLAKELGVRVIGPNCMGVYSPSVRLSFSVDFPKESGPVGLICQSGGNTLYLVRAAAQRGVRFSKVVSYGNACDMDECELLEYFAQDPQTEIVAAYMEGVHNGVRFKRVLSELAARKPVVVLKGGSTEGGLQAAASHTGSLAGSDEVWDALLDQTGAVRAHTLDELVDMMVTFRFMPVPAGRKVCVFGVGGGATVITTDDCASSGFVLPSLPGPMRDELRSAVGGDAGAILGNPVDFPFWLAREDRYRHVLSRLLDWEGTDLMFFQIPLRSAMEELDGARVTINSLLDDTIEARGGSPKPMAVIVHCLATAEAWHAASEFATKCYEAGLPFYYSTSSAALAVDRLMRSQSRKVGVDGRG